MARLTGFKGRKAGFITINLSTPELLSQPTIGPVVMSNVVIPFDMVKSPVSGWPTQLCAASLLWSSRVLGVVVKDRRGLFHAVETTHPRIPLGAKTSFDESKFNDFEIVELVNVPIVEFHGANQRPLGSPNECFVDSRLDTYKPSTTAGRTLSRDIKNGLDKWDRWWQRSVKYASGKPTPPPQEIAQPFVDAVCALFGVTEGQVGVLQSPGELISDRIAIDLYERENRGHGGSVREDIIKRIRNVPGFDLPVALTLLAISFRDSIPLLGMVGTGIHEGAHYRHYALTRKLIDNWHKKARHKPSSGTIGKTTALREFMRFLYKQTGRRGSISKNEYTIVRSTLRIAQASHPLSQFHAFLGNYASYYRDRRTDRKDRTLTLQPRFEQLLKGIDHWHKIGERSIRELCVTELADFAERDGACTRTDVLALFGEFQGSLNHSAQAFFEKLSPILNRP